MKIKDLPVNQPLDSVAFLHPETGERCYWMSQWQKGVWYRKSPDDTRVHPLPLSDITEALEFEIAP